MRTVPLDRKEIDVVFPPKFNIGYFIIHDGLIFKTFAPTQNRIPSAHTFIYTIPDPDDENSILFSATIEEWMRKYHNYCIDHKTEETPFNKETEIHNFCGVRFLFSPPGVTVNIPVECERAFAQSPSKNNVTFEIDLSTNHLYTHGGKIIAIYCNEICEEVKALMEKMRQR